MKVLSEIVAMVVVLTSGLWIYFEPGFEPIIVFTVAISSLAKLGYERFKNRNVKTILGQVLRPAMRQIDRRRAITTMVFDTLSGSQAIHHEIKAWAVWDDVGPTGRIEMRHKRSSGSWSTFGSFEGHHVELETKDVDGDGNPELLVRYACGAHTRVLLIYRIAISGFLEQIPGSCVGSDWPEIKVEDRDNDGKFEIYAKQRNWKGVPCAEFLQEVYMYKNGDFEKVDTAPVDT